MKPRDLIYLAPLIGFWGCGAAQPITQKEAALPKSLKWEASAPLVLPMSDAAHSGIAVKDPSVVQVGERWHLFATTADDKNGWSMVYLQFSDWAKAAQAKPHFLDLNPGLKGYHCAPQVFYFRPQKKWYLIFQSGQPQYSTSDVIDDPSSWSKPVDFFEGVPSSVVDKAWLDFWVICDQTHAYLFFTGDNGLFYRSRTRIQDFPRGMSAPVVVLREPVAGNLYEAGATYHLKGGKGYLTLIEAMGPGGKRFYRSFGTDSLDGEWKPLDSTWEHPFAGMSNVVFQQGVEPWTVDISHGELIREGYDETMTLDPRHLRLLFQGRSPQSDGLPYFKLPYRLGLLKQLDP